MYKIHTDIDNFNGEGMKHLREFERKLLKKQMNMRKWEKRKSPFPNETSPVISPIKQKHIFYMNT